MCVVPLCVVYNVCVCVGGWCKGGVYVGLSWVSVCVCLCAFYLCVFSCVCVPMNTVLQMISRECV